MPKPKKSRPAPEAANDAHAESDLALRPQVGTQPPFKKRKPAQRYRCHSSLSPALEWDGPIAVKAIDDQGNDLLMVKKLEAEK